MERLNFKTAIIFGGSGFIGTYLTRVLLQKAIVETIVLADICEPKEAFDTSRVSFQQIDVRNDIPILLCADQSARKPDLIINLAAVHREPGHSPTEYFQTNLQGAENVCNYAEIVGCKNIIFTSSISPYGSTEEQIEKDETTLPTPNTAYGVSKLVAEKIHLCWQRAGKERSLLIVRPGVIFGHGENGNVTRMIKAILGKYFVYVGNQKTRKAGGYVKELCESITWMIQSMTTNQKKFALYNFTMDPPPTVEEYVIAINRVTKKDIFVANLPFSIILFGSYFVHAFSRFFRINQSINPVRIKKLVLSNCVLPNVLKDTGYKYHYTLEDALTDWKNEYPEDWK